MQLFIPKVRDIHKYRCKTQNIFIKYIHYSKLSHPLTFVVISDEVWRVVRQTVGLFFMVLLILW